MAELTTNDIARISDDSLPSYEDACRVSQSDPLVEHQVKELELGARIAKHLEPEIGFVERLVLFFSNHFSMTIRKGGPIRATIGQFERDVIRKHVLGSFKSMLIGVMKHPAMMHFLDNATSVGPHSVYGQEEGKGINVNLAREILELHTLGINGGYTQEDIVQLAYALSGWSFVRGWEADGYYNGGHPGNRGQFIFRPEWHEPGSRTILGETFAQPGLAQGQAILARLAVHPSTAQNIAFKLVRHFIADNPEPEMVNPIAAAFVNSGGNLRAVARALVTSPYAWTNGMRKIRTPYELHVAELRATGRDYDYELRGKAMISLAALNNIPWQHRTPDGIQDETANWAGPDAMRIRLERAQFSVKLLQRVGPISTPPLTLSRELFGAYLTPASWHAISAAPTFNEALTTVFMIPEFQRR